MAGSWLVAVEVEGAPGAVVVGVEGDAGGGEVEEEAACAVPGDAEVGGGLAGGEGGAAGKEPGEAGGTLLGGRFAVGSRHRGGMFHISAHGSHSGYEPHAAASISTRGSAAGMARARPFGCQDAPRPETRILPWAWSWARRARAVEVRRDARSERQMTLLQSIGSMA